ncbi:MAG: excinuclease ABC subunit UvrC [Nitriliruptoraceae bacterium]
MPHPAADLRPDPGSVPESPGCYLFRDAESRVVYVGKAKSLRARLSNYFQSVDALAPRTRAMLSVASEVEWIVVDSESAALHLEYTLIQRHRPRYNVRYRDDKSYPYLVLSTSEEVPRARVQRGGVHRDDRRFGPYAHAYAIRETLDLLLPIFPVRTCSQGVFDRAVRSGRPCLLHHIDRCAGPCTGEIDVAGHRDLVDGLGRFLDGDATAVLRDLEAEMREAAAALDFERAARRRDQIESARRALDRQEVVGHGNDDFDVVAVHDEELDASVQAFFVRHGRLVGRTGFSVEKVEPLTVPELLTSALLRLYAERVSEIPGEVLVPELPDDVDVLADLLTEQRATHGARRGAVRFRVPQRGARATLLRTVQDNATQAHERARLRRASDLDRRSRSLRELGGALGLDVGPLRIECFDISHLGGTGVVGSMVVFEDGLPRRSDYRHFRLRVDANDDYAAMREVVGRRFRRLVESASDPARTSGTSGASRGAGFALRPDLVIIDGGPGQLGAALDAVADLGLGDLAFVALAKRLEELWLPGASSSIMLPRGSDALHLVQQLRDEAHRFAISHQRRTRRASVRASALDAVDGVGPARRQALLRRFGSVAQVRRASVEDLAATPGISRTLAEQVHRALGVPQEEST